MNILLFLAPASVALGAMGLLAFLWTMKADQYDDPKGAAERAAEVRRPGQRGHRVHHPHTAQHARGTAEGHRTRSAGPAICPAPAPASPS